MSAKLYVGSVVSLTATHLPLSDTDCLALFLPVPLRPLLSLSLPWSMVTLLSCCLNRCAPVCVSVFDNIEI